MTSLVFALPLVASAQPIARMTFPVSALHAAQMAAIQYWHRDPCDGRVRIVYRPHLRHEYGVALSAVTTAVTTSTANVYTDCVITINRTQFSARRQAARFPVFCGLMVHEYGHLLGHWDDPRLDSPESITYPLITWANEHVRPCVGWYRAFRARGS